MRAIDADYLKEHLMACAINGRPLHRMYTELDELLVAIDDVPTIETEPKWIPCSERLPEDVEIGDEYPIVIFCTKDDVYSGFYEYYRGGAWWSSSGDCRVDGVIAWMPLPEPYREERRADE